ncbi:MAG: HAD-IIA family hydrolase [Anaerolineae bacterium]
MPGLSRFFDVLARRGIRWALLTNNSTATVNEYISRLAGFGIPARPEQVVTSAMATARRLSEVYPPGTAFYVIGERGIQAHLEEEGFTIYTGEVLPPQPVAAVVMGLDRSFGYRRLAVATRLVRNGAAFYATNADATFPMPGGIAPGAGALLAALIATTDRQPIVIGKPQPAIYEMALKQLNAPADTAVMLGDRMDTDILGARRFGIPALLVLTGVTRREDLARYDYQPDAVYDDISALAAALEENV